MRGIALVAWMLAGCHVILPLDAREDVVARDTAEVGVPADGPTAEADLPPVRPPPDGLVSIDVPSLDGLPPSKEAAPPPDQQQGICAANPVYDGQFKNGWSMVSSDPVAPWVESSSGQLVWDPGDNLSAFHHGKNGTVFVQPPGCATVNVELVTICSQMAGSVIFLMLYDSTCASDSVCDGLTALVDVGAPCSTRISKSTIKRPLAPNTVVKTLRLWSPPSAAERRAVELTLTPIP